MQEINLLDNRLKDTTQVWERRNRLLVTMFSLILILEIGLALVFFILTQGFDKKTQTAMASNNNIQAEINRSQEELSEAKGFQAQLKNTRALLDSHIYWSTFFEEVSDYSLSTVTYDAFQGGVDGKIHLEGAAGSYTEVGKMLLGLNRSDKFSNVKLLSINPASGEVSGFVFSIDLVASKELFIEKN